MIASFAEFSARNREIHLFRCLLLLVDRSVRIYARQGVAIFSFCSVSEAARKLRATLCWAHPEEVFRYANGGVSGGSDRVIWEEKDPVFVSCAEGIGRFSGADCRVLPRGAWFFR